MDFFYFFSHVTQWEIFYFTMPHNVATSGWWLGFWWPISEYQFHFRHIRIWLPKSINWTTAKFPIHKARLSTAWQFNSLHWSLSILRFHSLKCFGLNRLVLDQTECPAYDQFWHPLFSPRKIIQENYLRANGQECRMRTQKKKSSVSCFVFSHGFLCIYDYFNMKITMQSESPMVTGIVIDFFARMKVLLNVFKVVLMPLQLSGQVISLGISHINGQIMVLDWAWKQGLSQYKLPSPIERDGHFP